MKRPLLFLKQESFKNECLTFFKPRNIIFNRFGHPVYKGLCSKIHSRDFTARLIFKKKTGNPNSVLVGRAGLISIDAYLEELANSLKQCRPCIKRRFDLVCGNFAFYPLNYKKNKGLMEGGGGGVGK